MANFHTPTDPQRPPRPDAGTDALREPGRLDNELQADPELQEGRASGGRIFAYGAAILVVLGVVFYGLNSSSPNPPDAARTASQSAPANNMADSNSRPPLAPGVRDVTPTRDNSGMTTGAAPARPQAPPSGAANNSSKGGAAN